MSDAVQAEAECSQPRDPADVKGKRKVSIGLSIPLSRHELCV